MLTLVRVASWLLLLALVGLSQAAYDPVLLRQYLPESPYRHMTPVLAGVAALLALASAAADPGGGFGALLHRPKLDQLRAVWRPFIAAIALIEGSRQALGYVENWDIYSTLAELDWTSCIFTIILILRCFVMAAVAWRLLQGGTPSLVWRWVGFVSAALSLVLLLNVLWHLIDFKILGSGGPAARAWFFNLAPVTVDFIAIWTGVALARGAVCGSADPTLSAPRWAIRVVYLFVSYRVLSLAYGGINLRLSLDIHKGQPVFWPNVLLYLVALFLALGHGLRATQSLGYGNRPLKHLASRETPSIY